MIKETGSESEATDAQVAVVSPVRARQITDLIFMFS